MGERRLSTGEALVNIALGLMREVKEDLKRMDSKLDKIAEERREEAREHGDLEARLRAVEQAQKSNRALAGTALAGVGIGLFIAFIKLLASHPEAIK